MSTQQEQIKEKFVEIIELAKKLYSVDLSVVKLDFNLKGRAAGMASWRGSHFSKERSYKIRINRDMMMREFDDMLNDTLPHEAAHIVCFMNPSLGSNHDYGWARVCRALGGTGGRTHANEVVYGNGRTYEYTATTGKTYRLSEQRHKKIQQGAVMTVKRSSGGGRIDKTCTYVIVGYQGRTLDKPVPGRAPTATPVNPVVAAARQSFNIGAAPTPRPAAPRPAPVASIGTSKADNARRLITEGHARGDSVETIIMAIMVVNKHEYGLAKSYYQNNAPKMGYPAI
jgi:predicted SprT family Zn-dependent metalloprotease